jgi:hypothetical protein
METGTLQLIVIDSEDTSHRRDFPPGTNLDDCGAVLWFTDAAGVRWVRRTGGYLGEQE